MKIKSWLACGAALALGCLAFPLTRAAEAAAGADAEKLNIALETLNRLKGMDLEANPALKGAVLKVLDQLRGRPQFVEVARDFGIKDRDADLLEIAIAKPADAAGVEAFRLVLEHESTNLIQTVLTGTNVVAATKLAEAAGNSGASQTVHLLLPLVSDPARDATLRKQSVRALAKTEAGAGALLTLAAGGKLPEDLKFTASSELGGIRWPKLREEALKLLPPPPGKNAEPLPPIAELAKAKGDAKHGAEVYRREEVGCIKCHQVNGEGIDFGPRLSEIGVKLGKDALYEAILDPSAGISFGFEPWSIELKNGDEAYGLVVSETPEELSVKAQTGIVTRYKKSEIAKRQMQKLSIMPAGLQQTMSTQDLIDLVEYLTTLKKAKE